MTLDISVQLYTVRDALALDLRGTLERLVAIGYRAVEPYNLAATAGPLGPALLELGLRAPSAHARLISVELEPLLEAASKIGISTVINSSSDPALWSTRRGIESVADHLNIAAELASDYGIRIGYHNHAWELGHDFDGDTGLEVLAGHLSESIVLEVDTYWAAVAGHDVPSLLDRLGTRAQYLHLKDAKTIAEHSAQVAVGAGVMPVDRILEVAPDALRVVELDQSEGDVFDAVEDSFNWLAARSGS
ncbi:sugar phosphate isomerase/epimerase family protein [Jiangella endophytica]|uniref:sugar phosphate isomerase/epimerase family protein n=1 Tax=Jiangella endophytica TaxID=1623398 RepID=UPI000E34DA5D|nr:sugar phosphate isomerase/epimerase [Jiangella endophytica]